MTDDAELETAIKAWAVDGAPVGFADRVLRHADAPGPPTPAPRRRSAWPWTAVAAAVAVAAVLLAWRGRGPEQAGTIDAQDGGTYEIPRATLVADARTRLEWSTHADTAVDVEQRTGRVFYRVQRDSVFSVITPLGRVEVEGTSFEVEIEPMKSNRAIKGAAAGMAVAAAVTVSLYEGRVVVAGEQGQTRLAPGQSARLRRGRAPETFERGSVAALQRENRDLRGKLEAERRRRIGEGSREPVGAASPPVVAEPTDAEAETERVRKCALSIGHGACSLTEPSQAVLERRADCGVVVYDRPDAMWSPDVDFTELAELTGLTAAELERVEDGTQAFHVHVRDEFATIYEQLGGAPELAAKLSTAGLTGEIERMMRDEDVWASSFDDTSRQIAAALAGRAAPPKPADLKPPEQAALLFTASGDLYEEWLGEYIGAARAAELRRAKDGWPGARGMNGTPHCPD